MTRLEPAQADAPSVDLRRWPDLGRPAPVGIRGPFVRALVRRMAEHCGIRVVLPDRRLGPESGPTLVVHDPQAFTARLARTGKIGFAESYMAEEWDAPDLVAVVEALLTGMLSAIPRVLVPLGRLADVAAPPGEANDRAGARRNIARHYDLSNELFSTFLDESLSYSSALFLDPGGTPDPDELAAGQRRKIDRLLERTGVGPGTRLLEIGTGWGELALRAAGRGAAVTTLTLSEAQAGLARQRVAAAGLAHLVEVRVEDYRDTVGLYDAIVSVEMIEAVGPQQWQTYFRVLDEHLAADGRVGLQAILMDHDRMEATRRSWTWNQKYVFPGGLIPSERAIADSLAATRLAIEDRLCFGASYARTLAAWRSRFYAAGAEVEQLGFDRTFRRMWEFYLAQSEAGFRTGYLDVAQFVLSRPE